MECTLLLAAPARCAAPIPAPPWDADPKTIPHLSRCQSSDEIALLRDLLEQQFRHEKSLEQQAAAGFEAAGLGHLWARR